MCHLLFSSGKGREAVVEPGALGRRPWRKQSGALGTREYHGYWREGANCQEERCRLSRIRQRLFTSLDFSRVFVAATLTTVTTAENPACDAAPENEFSF